MLDQSHLIGAEAPDLMCFDPFFQNYPQPKRPKNPDEKRRRCRPYANYLFTLLPFYPVTRGGRVCDTFQGLAHLQIHQSNNLTNPNSDSPGGMSVWWLGVIPHKGGSPVHVALPCARKFEARDLSCGAHCVSFGPFNPALKGGAIHLNADPC